MSAHHQNEPRYGNCCGPHLESLRHDKDKRVWGICREVSSADLCARCADDLVRWEHKHRNRLQGTFGQLDPSNYTIYDVSSRNWRTVRVAEAVESWGVLHCAKGCWHWSPTTPWLICVSNSSPVCTHSDSAHPLAVVPACSRDMFPATNLFHVSYIPLFGHMTPYIVLYLYRRIAS